VYVLYASHVLNFSGSGDETYLSPIYDKIEFVALLRHKIFVSFIEFSSMISTRDEKILKRFGKHLEDIRNSKNLSLRELADNADLVQNPIAMIN